VTHTLAVDAEAAGERVDLFVGKKLELSRAKLKALFEGGFVRVDGKRVKKGHTVAAGQRVDVELAEEGPRAPVPQPELPLKVLREDGALVFVDKPAGVPVHPLQPGEKGTVANALVARYPELPEASVDPREAGLVHRLDVETSGVLLAARDRDTWNDLRAQFSGGDEAVKLYLALVHGPIADDGEIELALEQHGERVKPSFDGRPARSTFRVLARDGERSLVEVRIYTGVMHQVRAHLAAIGAPIVGDTLYGGPAEPRLHRFFLHAASLEVRDPRSGTRVRVQSDLPDELRVLAPR
jgi:23S rRNA pseudouridine1911/1915/1917 synthase